jgi:hypothetical protein
MDAMQRSLERRSCCPPSARRRALCVGYFRMSNGALSVLIPAALNARATSVCEPAGRGQVATTLAM